MKIQLTAGLGIGLLVFAIIAVASSGTITRAYAQNMPTMPQIQQVSGTYVNEDAGLEITLPDEWSGTATSYGQYSSVIAVPGGLSGATEMPSAMMVISVITKNSTEDKNLPDSAKQPPNTQGQKPSCKDPEISTVTINGMKGDLITIECTQAGKVWKIKNYYFQTNERFYSVAFVSTSESDYDDNVKTFDDSAHTLKIADTIDAPGIPSSSTPGSVGAEVSLKAHKEKVHLGANNKDVDLNFDTSSNITEFKFDESSKVIRFKVSGADGSQGTTVLHVSSLLKGPYIVTFDGKTMTDFETKTDQTTGDTTITIKYHHSTHDISVSGTEVVPEFPLPAVGAIVAIIGIVAIVGRTRLVSGGIP